MGAKKTLEKTERLKKQREAADKSSKDSLADFKLEE